MTFIRHWQVNLMTVNLGPGQHSHFLRCFPLGRMLVDCCMLSRNISKTAAIIWSGSGGLCLSSWGNLDHSPFFVLTRKVKGREPSISRAPELSEIKCQQMLNANVTEMWKSEENELIKMKPPTLLNFIVQEVRIYEKWNEISGNVECDC